MDEQIQSSCPKCGNKNPLQQEHLVYYINATRAESERLNYAHSICQICGHTWNKYGEGEGK